MGRVGEKLKVVEKMVAGRGGDLVGVGRKKKEENARRKKKLSWIGENPPNVGGKTSHGG